MKIIKEIPYCLDSGKTQYDDKDNDTVRVFVDMTKGELRRFKRQIKNDEIKPQLCDVLALPRYSPFSSGYGDGYMCPSKCGEWIEREEVKEILRKYFT